MKKLIVICAFLFSSAAMAQDATLTVNQAELGLIGKGLGKLTFDEAAPLINKLQGQVIEQQKKAEVKPTEKPVDNAAPIK